MNEKASATSRGRYGDLVRNAVEDVLDKMFRTESENEITWRCGRNGVEERLETRTNDRVETE